MSVSTLPSAGGLDVNELSQKLATIPTCEGGGEGEGEGEGEGGGTREGSESSSTAAIFGSESGKFGYHLQLSWVYMWWNVPWSS